MSEGVPLWRDARAAPALPALEGELDLDVAIVGAGMVGLHCALNLRRSGLRLAAFEARRIGEQATGR